MMFRAAWCRLAVVERRPCRDRRAPLGYGPPQASACDRTDADQSAVGNRFRKIVATTREPFIPWSPHGIFENQLSLFFVIAISSFDTLCTSRNNFVHCLEHLPDFCRPRGREAGRCVPCRLHGLRPLPQPVLLLSRMVRDGRRENLPFAANGTARSCKEAAERSRIASPSGCRSGRARSSVRLPGPRARGRIGRRSHDARPARRRPGPRLRRRPVRSPGAAARGTARRPGTVRRAPRSRS